MLKVSVLKIKRIIKINNVTTNIIEIKSLIL